MNMYWLHAGFVLAHVQHPHKQKHVPSYLHIYLSDLGVGDPPQAGVANLNPHIEQMALIPPLVATTYY